jgi:cysteinyl-tRNA synthetase
MTTTTGKPVYLHNTLTRKKELFTPLDPPRVGMYTCGPTVYKDIHIGNFRAYMTMDWLHRMLEYNGYEVFLVRNITDVGHLHDTDDERGGEDKLEHEARALGKSAYEIANYYTRQFFRDEAELNILPPQVNPKATDHIPEMQVMIEQLLAKGLAYVADSNIYYDVSHFPDYGELSGNTVEKLREGGHGRQQMEVAEDKEAPEDFALWKHGEPTRQMNWESPWGVGFPGWHIECSAMSKKYLGEQFDIHSGGIDLVFPHHEDEIAQSQGVSGEPPVRYWVHNEFLIFGNLKMSRSKGNVVLVSTLKERGIDPMAYRYLLLTAHYRSKQHFTDESIAAAQNGLNNLREELAGLLADARSDAGSQNTDTWSPEAQSAREAFHLAINDDMDMPTALSVTREAARNARIAPAERVRLLLDFDRVLGLRLDTVEPEEARAVSEEALALVKERDAARAAKNWQRSDELRQQLQALGYEVRDTAQGTQLR